MYDESYYKNFLNVYSSVGTHSSSSMYSNYVNDCQRNDSNLGNLCISQNAFNMLLSDIKNIEKY